MRTDILAEQTFGKIALRKMAPTDPNFRLFKAGWLGDGKKYEVMSVTGAVFRESLSGKNKGKLTKMIAHTSRNVHVTAQEIRDFEIAESSAKSEKAK